MTDNRTKGWPYVSRPCGYTLPMRCTRCGRVAPPRAGFREACRATRWSLCDGVFMGFDDDKSVEICRTKRLVRFGGFPGIPYPTEES